MTDVLIGHSYFLRFDPKLWRDRRPYPPLGTLYAAACVRSIGLETAVFDAVLADSTKEWHAALDRLCPRFAVLFEDNFNYLSKMCLLRMRSAAFDMIDAAVARGCVVIVCGSDATDQTEAYLRAGADYVLVGEGEETLQELLTEVSASRSPDVHSIRGVAFEDAGRSVVRTSPRTVMTDLDSLPRPAWDLIDVERYRQEWMVRHGYFALNIVTSRGCPFHCNWCAKPIWGQRYNAHSPERVVAEMQQLRTAFGADYFWFMDDMLGVRPGWTSRFADLIEEGGVRTPFKSLNRVDLLLRDGEIDALRRAGCDIVWSGVESGSQRILDAMDKGIRINQIEEASALLREAGIRTGFFLQFGYPGETRADIRETFALVRRCRPDQIGVSVSYPLPGTPFHAMVKDQFGRQQNWDDSDDLAMLYRGPYSTTFYRRLHRVLHKEYRLRKAARRLIALGRVGCEKGRRNHRPQGSKTARMFNSIGNEIAALAYNALTLPIARIGLEAAAVFSSARLDPLKSRLSRAAAAVPTSHPSDEVPDRSRRDAISADAPESSTDIDAGRQRFPSGLKSTA